MKHHSEEFGFVASLRLSDTRPDLNARSEVYESDGTPMKESPVFAEK